MSRLNVEPLSREFLLQQKRCCKNSCVFCPYKNKNMENKEKNMLEQTQGLIDCCPSEVKEKLSDGYHSFEELYNFRKIYNAVLFNEWAKEAMEIKKLEDDGHWVSYSKGANIPKYNVHKSWKHYDGELCFGGGWFIVVAVLPTGQISNHYKAEDWDLFQIPEVDKALYEFDGHSSQDVLERLKSLTNGK